MGLLGKTVFVLPPTTLRSARKSGSSAKAWTEVALQIADPNLREVLGRIDTSDALAIWRGRDGRVFVVRGDTRRFEFYEAALRIAYYELRHGCPTEAF
jgi:hypothetical protein